MEIIDGKKVSREILADLKKEIKNFSRPPRLEIIFTQDDPESKVYINKKIEACNKVGIDARLVCPEKDAPAIIKAITDANADSETDAILLQLPLPEGLNTSFIVDHIDPKKDVDGLTSLNQGRLTLGLKAFIPATPKGIMRLLKKYNVSLSGKNVLLVGRSTLIGKPLAQLLLNKDATVTIAHSKTVGLKKLALISDIVISAAGVPGLITKEMLKKDAVVIDAGFTVVSGKAAGDVDFLNVLDRVSLITPVPGGVGPMTVACLLENVVASFKFASGDNK